jgi:hypothetical protein
MNDKFDQLAKGLAQSVTRRGALKKLRVGLAGIALAMLGLANKAVACGGSYGFCKAHCKKLYPIGSPDFINCVSFCMEGCVG